MQDMSLGEEKLLHDPLGLWPPPAPRRRLVAVGADGRAGRGATGNGPLSAHVSAAATERAE